MNFFIFLILLVKVFVECDSSCETKDVNITAVQQMLWEKYYYYDNYELAHRSLVTLLRYFRDKTILVNIVDEEFPKLQCGIETICTSTKSNILKQVEKRNYRSFCEIFFVFEHKNEYVFTINHLQLVLYSHRNLTFYSSQLNIKFGIKVFNIR